MIPVLHSVGYAGVWPGQARLSLDEFVEKAGQLGYKGVMLMAKRPHLSVLDYGSSECARLRDKLERLGVQCSVIAGYNNFSADLEHGDVPLREMQIQHVTELARITRDLGAAVIRIFTSYEHPAIDYSRLWLLTVDAIRECARRASDFGVTVGVQNHHDLAVDPQSQYDLIQAVNEPNCRACYDAWSPALHGTDYLRAAERMAPLTCHTTAADYQLRPRFKYHPGIVNYTAEPAWVQAVPMGEGFIDYAGFLKALRKGGYNGSVGYEMCSPLLGGGSVENLDRYAGRFLGFISGLDH